MSDPMDLAATGAALSRLDAHLALRGNWARAETICRAIEASASASLAGYAAAADLILHLNAGLHHPAAREGVYLGLDTFRALELIGRMAFDADKLPTLDAIARLHLRARASSGSYLGSAPSGKPLELLERYLASGDPSDWPTAAEDAPEALDKVGDWLESTRALIEEHGHSLPVLAEAVRTFIAAAPFVDDTGRMARLLIPALLYRWGWTPAAPSVFPSLALAQLSRGRLDAALASRDAWMTLFLAVLRSAARTVEDRIVYLARQADRWRLLFANGRSTSALPSAVDWLFAHPVFSLAMLASGVNRTEHGARLVAERLVEERIVFRPPKRTYRAYSAGKLFEGVATRSVK